MVLFQPSAPRAQRRIELSGGRYAFAEDAGRRRYVLDFPLPGSRSGPADFRLYLAAPNADGMIAIGSDAEAARGFLLQTVGLRRGKTVFAGGYVRIEQTWPARDVHRLDLQIDCADDTRIGGSLFVKAGPELVRAFEQRYAADVRALSGAPAVAVNPGASPEAPAQATNETPASQPAGTADAPRYLAPPD